MGTVKRKLPPKQTEKNPVGPLVESLSTVFPLLEQVPDLLAEARAEKHVSQDLLSLLYRCNLLLSRLDSIKDAASSVLVSAKSGGTIEIGPMQLYVSEVERRTPAWKAEAIAKAKELAGIKRTQFDEKYYIEQVQAAATPSVARSVKIVDGSLTPKLED